MHSLRQQDKEAEFRFFGGDLMAAEGGTMVRHYRNLAYMGFIPVLLHLPTILRNMRFCKQDILSWQPDAVILVDYPGFNLDIAQFVKAHAICPVYYYIAPKIWAWKEYRIKRIKRDIDELFSILPFEVDFFEGKHHYPIHYVGNPTASEVKAFLKDHERIPPTKPVIALLCGSRRQEIRDNLPAMLEATAPYVNDYQIVVAGAPGIEADYYTQFAKGYQVQVWPQGSTYSLLSTAHAALVTSGTATLETCLFGVPQVVCYAMRMSWLFGLLRRLLLKVKYVSLVNLIADREVVKELVADTFSVEAIQQELQTILQPDVRQRMLQGYEEVCRRLGDKNASEEAAKIITQNR
jgi:lipid-A-disaccharide synthase